MNKTNIKCPRCHSEKLYKFVFDNQANQKYQCKECGRQFVPSLSVTVQNLNILDVLNVIKQHIFTINTITTIVINVEAKSVIMLSLNITI